MTDKEIMTSGYPQNVVKAVFGFTPAKLDDPDLGAGDAALLMGDRGALEIAMILAGLTDREASIIRKRYQEMKNLQEVETDFGISPERTRQIEHRALRKLRREQCLKLFQLGAYKWLMDLVDKEAEFKARRMAGQMLNNELQVRLERAQQIMDEQEAEKLRIALDEDELMRAGGKGNLDSILIDEMELSVRSFNCLRRGGVRTVGDLVSMTHEELMNIRNLGRKCLEEIEQTIKQMGLKLKESEEEPQ